jgi:hypothetical protein
MGPVRKKAGLGFAAGVLGTIGVLAVIGLTVVYTVAFNVAATEEHQSITRWAFDSTFHNDVELRASDVLVPEQSPAMTPERYAEMGGSTKEGQGSGNHGG